MSTCSKFSRWAAVCAIPRANRSSFSRERVSRTIFAQHAIKPAEVQRELEEVDAALGDPETVERFVRTVCQRLEARLLPLSQGTWQLEIGKLPATVRDRLPDAMRRAGEKVRIAFRSPTPPNTHYIGRNHPLTEALAEEVLGMALTRGGIDGLACARAAVIRSSLVQRQTTLFLLRLRYLLHMRGQALPLLAEGVIAAGLVGRPGKGQRLGQREALQFLQTACPDAPVSPNMQREFLERVLTWWIHGELDAFFQEVMQERQQRIEEAYRRVHQAARMTSAIRVEPKWPPDGLGVYVLLPYPRGSRTH